MQSRRARKGDHNPDRLHRVSRLMSLGAGTSIFFNAPRKRVRQREYLMKRLMTKMATLAVFAAAGAVFAGPASAQATLDAVKNRGKVLCGVSPSSAGYSFADDKGVRKGFDSDVCRAVSSA